jgi:hypothetical protein
MNQIDDAAITEAMMHEGYAKEESDVEVFDDGTVFVHAGGAYPLHFSAEQVEGIITRYLNS